MLDRGCKERDRYNLQSGNVRKKSRHMKRERIDERSLQEDHLKISLKLNLVYSGKIHETKEISSINKVRHMKVSWKK